MGTLTELTSRHCPSCTHFECTDVDQLSEAGRKWSAEFVQLRPGPLRARIVFVPLGPVRIGIGIFNQPLLHRGFAPTSGITLVLPEADCDSFLLQGQPVEQGQCAVMMAGSDQNAISRGRLAVVTISIDAKMWAGLKGHATDRPMPIGGGVEVLTPGSLWTQAVLQGVASIMRVLSIQPWSTVRAPQDLLMGALLSHVRRLEAWTRVPSTARDTHAGRRLAVNRARSYIDGHLTEPIRLSDLCEQAHTQSRSLEYGFREVVGMSPVAYIRALRLNLARQLLKSSHGEHTVTQVALDCGFWHLSQFAVDYKRHFGESPSATGRRTTVESMRCGLPFPMGAIPASGMAARWGTSMYRCDRLQ
jgi:AraC family ethanolamine operon transcriptional activator